MAAVQVLFAAANVAHWQNFVSADILAAGYVTTSVHLLFGALQCLAARAATSSGSLTAEPA